MQEGGVEDRPGPAARGTNGDHEAPFGAELKRLRYAAGLTQEELASRAGLTAKAVSALERDVRKRPYPHTVRSLTDALDLTDAERATLQAAVPGRGERVRAPDAGAPPAVLRTQPGRLRAGAEVAEGEPGPATGARRQERHG
jgi:transcriptional regulator with XRE-family HTH domain